MALRSEAEPNHECIEKNKYSSVCIPSKMTKFACPYDEKNSLLWLKNILPSILVKSKVSQPKFSTKQLVYLIIGSFKKMKAISVKFGDLDGSMVDNFEPLLPQKAKICKKSAMFLGKFYWLNLTFSILLHNIEIMKML